MIRRILTFALSLALLIAVSAPAAGYEGQFSDVPPTHWAVPDIEKAVSLGLMEGLGDGRFGLEQSIDRAAFVTILCRMFSWEMIAPETPSFSDCAGGTWYYSAVETAAAHGVVTAGGSFRPAEAISRLEMAEMLVRALGYEPLVSYVSDLESPFVDISGNGYVNIAYDVGMSRGVVEDGRLRFNPGSAANREEAAAMLSRVYERYLKPIEWLHAFYAFASYSQIDLTAQMDAVSVGWARLDYDGETGPFLNQKVGNGNYWTVPSGASTATNFFKSNHTPYNLNVYAGTGDKVTLADGTETNDVYATISSPQSRAQAISALVAAVPEYAGITIDFEGMKGQEQKENFTTFMAELRDALPADKTLYVCVPPLDWYTGFDYLALGEICDKVILMAHDYNWTSIGENYIGTDHMNSPYAPLTKIYSALRRITDPETGVQDKSKLALAIAYGSAGFQVDENKLLASTTIYKPAQEVIEARLQQADTELCWSEEYASPYMYYTGDDGNRYLMWYEDARSTAAKVELARMFGITGISLWRLGNVPQLKTDGLFYDAWSAILDLR